MVARPSLKKTRWSIHSMFDIDGTPYAVLEEYGLYEMSKEAYEESHSSMCVMPEGTFKIEPLEEIIENKAEFVEGVESLK